MNDFVVGSKEPKSENTNDILRKIAELNAATHSENKPPDVTVTVTASKDELDELKKIEENEKLHAAVKHVGPGNLLKLRRQRQISERVGEILKEHQGLESNVPVNPTHEYWVLLNELRAL